MQTPKLELSRAIDLSIHLSSDGKQPNFFGAEAAETQSFPDSDTAMDTRRGASCNVSSIRLTPHCNGTHTECVGHITDQRINVLDVPPPLWQEAMLVSTTYSTPETSDDSLPEFAETGDKIIDLAASADWQDGWRDYSALIVRTMPNDDSKTSRLYTTSADYPYCSPELIGAIADSNVEHLLIDTPSVDRMFDQGRLINHRSFWGLAEDDRNYRNVQFPQRTITELIYVPDEVSDGRYWLNLQLMPLSADAVPSRPVIVKPSEFL